MDDGKSKVFQSSTLKTASDKTLKERVFVVRRALTGGRVTSAATDSTFVKDSNGGKVEKAKARAT